MKVDRLIGIITLLLQRGKVTAPELADRFEVSRRTISRDIETLCQAGIPIVTTQGYGGGISIAEGYKTDSFIFTQDELQTICSGLKGIDSISKTSYLETMLDKLSDKHNRILVQDFIIIDLASHYRTSLVEKIEMIKEAIINRYTVTFHYYYGKGEGKRRIEPYHLVFKWSSWYVFGFCLDRLDFRMFKLNRLWNLQKGEEFCSREVPQEKLEFGGYLSDSKERLAAVFKQSEKYRLIEEYGIDSFTVLDDGRLYLERHFANYEAMREWVFSFGDKVCVREPERLRQDRISQAKRILQDFGEMEL